jgi:glucokinase
MKKSYKKFVIGVDVGGSKISAVLFDGKKVLAGRTMATPASSLKEFLSALDDLIFPFLKNKKQKINGIGLGIPGIMDQKKEKILRCPNLSILDNVKLPALIQKRFNLKVAIANDADCFLRAEALTGVGRGKKNIFGLTIGTGIGGGWWIDNNVYVGANGAGGEPGRMIVNFSEPVELEKVYHDLMKSNPLEMFNQAKNVDQSAQKNFSEFGRQLGLALANIANLLDPEMFVIGGSVIGAEKYFLPIAEKTMRANLMSAEAKKKIKVVKSSLGALAGSIGAALLISCHHVAK